MLGEDCQVLMQGELIDHVLMLVDDYEINPGYAMGI
jgi:D-mannonate dehydratase